MSRWVSIAIGSFWGTALGTTLLKGLIAATRYRVFSGRTVKAMQFDLLRLRARARLTRNVHPASDRLHLGCNDRFVQGWLNVDVAGSEHDIDLAADCLPWADGSFSAIVSQHVIEHLDLQTELLPLLAELRRVTKLSGEIWLTCPDLAKACAAYVQDKGATLLADKMARSKINPVGDAPPQQFINCLFVQDGEHRNLLDLELLEWALRKCGFGEVTRMTEQDLLARFPEFPLRGDDYQSLYVRATPGA